MSKYTVGEWWPSGNESMSCLRTTTLKSPHSLYVDVFWLDVFPKGLACLKGIKSGVPGPQDSTYELHSLNGDMALFSPVSC